VWTTYFCWTLRGTVELYSASPTVSVQRTQWVMDAVSADGRDLPLSAVNSYEQLNGSSVSLGDILVVAGAGDVDNEDFERVAVEAVMALDNGVHAELITSGSSGSYYIRDRQKVTTLRSGLKPGPARPKR